MFNSSVVSYPDRGPYGNSRYRGNTTGKLIIDLIQSFLPENGFFIDPAIGGGTSVDVVNELGLQHRFAGFDLHSGYNLLRHDLLSAVGKKADLCFFHPPYGSMIQYSGNMWGEKHCDDLSQMSDSDFEQALKLALVNISDAIKDGGHYAVLIGNQRTRGEYKNWSSMTERLAPDPLVEEIIKIQNNCTSDSRTYSKPIVRIKHEKLLIFRKSPTVNAISSLESSLTSMNAIYMDELLVTLKRLMQCYEWSEPEMLEQLNHLNKLGPFDLPSSISTLLNSGHFVKNNGRYTIA